MQLPKLLIFATYMHLLIVIATILYQCYGSSASVYIVVHCLPPPMHRHIVTSYPWLKIMIHYPRKAAPSYLTNGLIVSKQIGEAAISPCYHL